MNEWQTMETAVYDGKNVLLGWWMTWPQVTWETEVAPAGNIDVSRMGCGSVHGYATHWMPLPEPPTEAQEGETE